MGFYGQAHCSMSQNLTHTKVPRVLTQREVTPRRAFIAHEVSIPASEIRFYYDLGGGEVRLNFTLGFRTVGHFSCRVISVERCLSFPVWSRARSLLFLRSFSPCLPPQILGRRPSLVAFVLRAYQSLWHSGYFTDKGSCSCYSSVVLLSHTPAPATVLRLWIHKESMDKDVSQHWLPNMKEAYLKWSLSTLSPSFNIN